MGSSPVLHLFQAYGLEIEYMLVDAATLDVLPAADRLLALGTGPGTPAGVADVERGDQAWSNELVLHLIELKTNGPAGALRGLALGFQRSVREINDILRNIGGRLLPTGAHPWMNPAREARLWPHSYAEVYDAFHRIFDCRSHGWANLQSVHLNLPFGGEEEFLRLHAAVRMLLPILPALAASSPFLEGKATGLLDSRLEAYRHHCDRIPAMVSNVIPEPVGSIEEYREVILEPIYRALGPYDTGGLLCHEWANARGAIARFDRSTIEIRVLDTQECPVADVAVASLVARVLRALVEERWGRVEALLRWPFEPLFDLLLAAIRHGEEATIRDRRYLESLGMGGVEACRAHELWLHLIDEVMPEDGGTRNWLSTYRSEGTLARRILQAAGPDPSKEQLASVYLRLCDCLAAGEIYSAPR